MRPIYLINFAQNREDASGLTDTIRSKKEFTTSVPTRKRKDFPWSTEIALISFDKVIGYLGLVTNKGGITTDHFRLKFTDIVDLKEIAWLENLAEELSFLTEFEVDKNNISGFVVESENTQSLINHLNQFSEKIDIQAEFVKLKKLLENSLVEGQDPQYIIPQQQDTMYIALRVAGFDNRSLEAIEMKTWKKKDYPQENLPRLARKLRNVELTEDQMISHDAFAFGDFKRVRRDTVGMTIFESKDKILTVINSNRTPIEHTLGVDMVY